MNHGQLLKLRGLRLRTLSPYLLRTHGRILKLRHYILSFLTSLDLSFGFYDFPQHSRTLDTLKTIQLWNLLARQINVTFSMR